MATIHDYIKSNAKPALEKAGIFDKNITSPSHLNDFSVDDIARRMAENNSLAIRSLKQEQDKLGRDINSYSENLRAVRERMKEVSEQVSSTASNIPTLFLTKQSELKKIMERLYINHIEYVPNGVTIFTTDFFLINATDPDWSEPKKIPLGWFRIWIDWNNPNTSSIKIFNFHHRYANHDHPCISDGGLCMGNASRQIDEAFRSKNAFALLEVLISFLMSENIRNGWIRSWREWLEGAKRVPSTKKIEDYGIRPYNREVLTAQEQQEIARMITPGERRQSEIGTNVLEFVPLPSLRLSSIRLNDFATEDLTLEPNGVPF